jgi:hypothetical protein
LARVSHDARRSSTRDREKPSAKDGLPEIDEPDGTGMRFYFLFTVSLFVHYPPCSVSHLNRSARSSSEPDRQRDLSRRYKLILKPVAHTEAPQFVAPSGSELNRTVSIRTGFLGTR